MTEAPAAAAMPPADARVDLFVARCAAAVEAIFARPDDAAAFAAVVAEASALVELAPAPAAALPPLARVAEPAAHALRVAIVAVALGRRLELAPGFLRALALGALLRDIGCALVPTPSNEAARRALERQHPTVGADLLRAHGRQGEVVCAVVLGHHERLDGSGYPFALEGADVPLAARIVGLADLYDALTRDRPGRPALAPGSALSMLRGPLAPQVDADLVAELAGLWGAEAGA